MLIYKAETHILLICLVVIIKYFFYGGKGWDPTKDMNGYQGGFVYQETFSKDDPIDLDGQRLEYELILQQNGNFQTKGSSENEVF